MRTLNAYTFRSWSYRCMTLAGLPLVEPTPEYEWEPYLQGIGVVQPQSGIDYPFVQPSEDIQGIVADFYLEYTDLADYDPDAVAFVRPFSLYWAYGLGQIPVATPTGAPSPTHAADLVILDANGQTVFDSTVDSTYAARDWADRFRIHQWLTSKISCHLVQYSMWGDTPTPPLLANQLAPDNGVLDERTCYRLPKYVWSLTALLEKVVGPVEFVNGYNTTLVHSGTVATPGGRAQEQITVGALAGSGLGRYPGCEAQPLVIRAINGVAPNARGDFRWGATDCYWVRRPTRVVSESPYLLAPTLPTIDPSLTDEQIAENYPTLFSPEWPESRNESHLQVGSDCKACCDCPDYAAVARYLNDTRDRYALLGVDAELARDLYHDNRDRWRTARSCFHRRPVRIAMQAQRCPFMDVVLSYCNQSSACKTNLKLQADFTGAASAVVLPEFTFITGARLVPGRTSTTTEAYTLFGAWPSFGAEWDFVQPGQSVSVRFRLDFGQCSTPLSITGRVTGTINDVPILVDPIPPSEVKVRAEATSTIALRCPMSSDAYHVGTVCTPTES